MTLPTAALYIQVFGNGVSSNQKIRMNGLILQTCCGHVFILCSQGKRKEGKKQFLTT